MAMQPDGEGLALEGLPLHRTAWDALGDLPEPDEDLRIRGKWGDLLSSIPEGSNYLWHTERGGGLPLFGWRRRFWNFLLVDDSGAAGSRGRTLSLEQPQIERPRAVPAPDVPG